MKPEDFIRLRAAIHEMLGYIGFIHDQKELEEFHRKRAKQLLRKYWDLRNENLPKAND